VNAAAGARLRIARNRVACVAGLMVNLSLASAEGPVDANVTPAMREYCHIIRFPLGWIVPPPLVTANQPPNVYGYDSEYEFRVPGLLETKFLIRGLILPYGQSTVNSYEVDLSDPKAVPVSATEAAWQSGTPVPTTRKISRPALRLTNDQSFPLNGFQLGKSGKIWPGDYDRMSPGQVWIVLMSSSGSRGFSDDVPLGLVRGRNRGTLFFDVYSVDGGKKIVTVQASYNGIGPDEAVGHAGWVTERYFIVPLGEHRERCLVCEFGGGRVAGGGKQ